MKVIIEHEDKANYYLAQYASQIEYLSAHHKIIDIEERYLSWLSECVNYIEPNFTIELSKEEVIEESLLQRENTILAFIGTTPANESIDIYYNMTTYDSKRVLKVTTASQCEYIKCYSENHKIGAVDYIKCIHNLANLSREYNKLIIIYASLYVPDETYRYRALTYKIINLELEAIKGLLKIKPIKKDVYKLLRQSNPLFDDVFYNSMSPGEEIYMLIRYSSLKSPEYYENLGFKDIRLIGNYSMLHGRKSQFDSNSEGLKSEVGASYPLNILSHVPCDKRDTIKEGSYSLVKENLKYKGKGVYIGLLTVDDVDYTNAALRMSDGASRIACIWRQTKADEGTYYFNEQINAALASSNPDEIIKLPDEDSMSTMMLSIAGGMSEQDAYRGVATEAEFIVAKLNTASDTLQRIYGGMPNKYAITLPDALVGIIKLIQFASQQGKPLALCMPFNGNINPHDGSLVIQQIISEIARTPSVTLIIPAGEEADKRHHYGIEGIQDKFGPININVPRNNQNVVGVLYQKFVTILTAELYAPRGIIIEPINLKRKDIIRINNTTIYSNGEEIDFLNGSKRIAFRIDNSQVGEWSIQESLQTNISSKVDLWISQEQLNPYITLTPSNTDTTVGSSACINNVMSVGGYNRDTSVVLGSSGRGYTWDNRVSPLFVTHANNIVAACNEREWVSVTGTLPAASIMLGAAANLYSKFSEEGLTTLPNTLVMNDIILNTVNQQEGVDYPNPSQGYGIFNLQSLE